MNQNTMAIIQCALCNEDIELEDGVSGTFSCPNCDIQFEWSNTVNTDIRAPVGTIIFATLSILGFIALFSLMGSPGDLRFLQEADLILPCFGICSIPVAIFALFAIKGK